MSCLNTNGKLCCGFSLLHVFKMIHSNWAHALIIREEKVLLIKRSSYKKAYPNEWDLPWWTTIDQEIPEQTITREIKEECWISQDSIINMSLLWAKQITDKNTQWYWTITFYCISLHQTSITLSHEHTTYAWAPLNQINTYLPQRSIIWLCLNLYNTYRNIS